MDKINVEFPVLLDKKGEFEKNGMSLLIPQLLLLISMAKLNTVLMRQLNGMIQN
ncbi:MAG: hypothetical protein KZQ70_10495 [gamma proteobacterium symbiont of Lucinoma myriamae]|nr:hypothetical protein [gamma proteobacterium symbiont of Lucinoma myriamae]